MKRQNYANIGCFCNANDRFPYCSTIKVPLVCAVLHNEPIEKLNKIISYTQKDILSYAPVTAQHIDTGMSIEKLCEAAIIVSDNTAANLLLKYIGGPIALKKQLIDIGDSVTEPTRIEPMLNEAIHVDRCDASTSYQLAMDYKIYLVENVVLTADKKELLIKWMTGNKVTDKLIRAGVPGECIVADKSGSGGYGTRNDIAIIMPTHQWKNAIMDDTLVSETAKIVYGELVKKYI